MKNITWQAILTVLKTKTAIAIISSAVVLGAGTTTYLALRNDRNVNQQDVEKETELKSDEEVVKKDAELKDTTVSEETQETDNTDATETTEDNTSATDTMTTTNQTNKTNANNKTETSNRTETTNKTETTTRPETSQPSTKPTTPTGTQAGLYQNGVLIKDWDKLIAEGTLSVDNDGSLTSGYSYETETNSSSDKLVGKLIIDNSVKNLGMGAFSYCEKLTDIILGSSVKEISKGAFFGCKNLKSIHISSSVTKIYSETFYGCQCLESISVDKNNTIYDSRNNCNAIIRKSDNMLMVGCKSTVIPTSVSSIGYGSFHGSVGLTSITIPESVVEIHPFAFEQCINLTVINYLGSQSQWESIEKYSQQFETVQINFAK